MVLSVSGRDRVGRGRDGGEGHRGVKDEGGYCEEFAHWSFLTALGVGWQLAGLDHFPHSVRAARFEFGAVLLAGGAHEFQGDGLGFAAWGLAKRPITCWVVALAFDFGRGLGIDRSADAQDFAALVGGPGFAAAGTSGPEDLAAD